MATIKTSLSLYDGMTGPLKNITAAMNLMVNSFESCQRASKNAIDTASLRSVREQLSQAETALDSMEESIKGADKAQRQFNGSLSQGTRNAGDLIDKLKSAAIVAGAIKLGKAAIGLSDTMVSTTARLNLIVDDGGSVEALQDKIMASATRARASYLDTADAIAKMGANAGSAFSGNDEMIAFMEQVNKQFVIGGSTAEGQSAAMLQLTQAMAAGALRGEELNSILENAPGIARAIESYMGIAEGSIKQYAEDGKVTAEVVKNALFSVADETNAKFESMPMTFAQIWQNIKNQALMAFQPILDRLNQIANSEQFQAFVQNIIQLIQQAASVAMTLFDSIMWVVNGLSQLGLLEPMIYGVVAALIAWKVATIAMKVAQVLLNTAMLASPITWIILAVVALAAAFVYLANKVGGFDVLWQYVCAAMQAGWSVASNTVLSGIDWMVYGMMWLYDICCDVWDWIEEAAVSTWNAIVDAVLSAVTWVVKLVQDMVNGIIGAINWLVDGINTIGGWLGVHLDHVQEQTFGDSVEDWKNSVTASNDAALAAMKAEHAAGNAQREQDLEDQAAKATATFQKGVSDATAAWAKADQYKADNQQTAEKTTGSGIGDGNGNGYTPQSYDALQNNVQNIDDNTTKMADSLSVSETELQYLREIAERQAINKFTTAEIRVEMTNHNNISGERDIDGIVEYLAEKVNEAMVVASEGVHT